LKGLVTAILLSALLAPLSERDIHPGEDYLEAVREYNIFETPGRDTWQKPYRVLALAGDLSQSTVAEIGCGTGYFTLRILPLVKKYIAIDISRRYLDHTRERVDRITKRYPALAGKVEYRLAERDDPRLQRGEADLILIVNTYHHLANHVSYFKRLKGSLSPGGKIMIIDYTDDENRVQGPPPSHGLYSKGEILAVMRAAGYRTVDRSGILPYQNLIVAYE
jgi:SAM-dependent methyltransferase